MLPKRTIAVAIAAVVVVIAVIGSVMLLSQAGSGTLTISVKDSVGEWKNVNVTFSEVQVHKAGNDSGWISLSIVNGNVDLASLTNVSELLASSSITSGNYTQIRIVVDSVNGTMTNGTSVNFTVPSGELIINHPFDITSGTEEKLTIDIDLEHSIVQNGESWTFKPVLGAVIEG